MLRPGVDLTGAAPAPVAAIRVSATVARRFEAIVFDWYGTAVPHRRADATRVRKLVEEASAHGLELAVVSGTHVSNVDGQLAARPRGPRGLVLALNSGSEVFSVDRDGPQLAFRRTATTEEDADLAHAAQLTVERLGAQGLRTRIVSERPGRRKIDLIPEPEWNAPPKARIAELLAAVESHLPAAGIAGLPEAVGGPETFAAGARGPNRAPPRRRAADRRRRPDMDARDRGGRSATRTGARVAADAGRRAPRDARKPSLRGTRGRLPPPRTITCADSLWTGCSTGSRRTRADRRESPIPSPLWPVFGVRGRTASMRCWLSTARRGRHGGRTPTS